MRALSDLVLPRACLCGARCDSGPLCGTCLRAIRAGPQLTRPHPAPPGLPECAVGGSYEGVLRRAVIAYKERGRRDLASELSRVLLGALLLLDPVRAALRTRARVVLVPVPLSRTGWRTRGFDQVELLVRLVVRAAARSPDVAGRLHCASLLEHVRRVGDQSGLGARARRENLAFSLRARAAAVRRPVRPGTVFVLVDDVLTTGATLAEAARALRAAGVATAACAAVAGVQRIDRGQSGPIR